MPSMITDSLKNLLFYLYFTEHKGICVWLYMNTENDKVWLQLGLLMHSVYHAEFRHLSISSNCM